MYNDFVLGLHGKVLGAGEQAAAEVALWEAAISFPHIQQSHFQLIWGQTCCWPSRAHQPWWQCLWDNVFKRGKNLLHNSSWQREWEHVGAAESSNPHWRFVGFVNPWGTSLGAGCSWRLAPHGRALHWSSSWRNAAPRICVGGVSGWTVSCGRIPKLDQRKNQKRKEVTDTKCNELIKILFPVPSQCWGGGGREFRRKVKPSKEKSAGGRGRWGAQRREMCFKFYSYISHYSTLIWMLIH